MKKTSGKIGPEVSLKGLRVLFAAAISHEAAAQQPGNQQGEAGRFRHWLVDVEARCKVTRVSRIGAELHCAQRVVIGRVGLDKKEFRTIRLITDRHAPAAEQKLDQAAVR